MERPSSPRDAPRPLARAVDEVSARLIDSFQPLFRDKEQKAKDNNFYFLLL